MNEEHEIDVPGRLAAGRQRFLDIEFLCGAGALVPRPETELLGRTAIAKARKRSERARVADVCCGVGNLGCAIALNVPAAEVWATDLTDACVDWTRKNVTTLGLDDRVTVAQGDLFQGLEGRGLEGTLDVVVCNPPYLSTARLSSGRAELLDFEPREAFDGGPYGLTIHQRVVAECPKFLKPGAWLLMEFGLGQERQIKLVFERGRRFEGVTFEHDAAGAPRVVVAQLRT